MIKKGWKIQKIRTKLQPSELFRGQKSENKLAKETEKERTARKEENQQSMLFGKSP